MPRAVAVLFALLLVVADPAAVRSQTNAPAGYDVVKTADLYSGVEYVKLAKAQGPVVAHVAHVLPGAAVDLQVVNAYDRISSSPGELETTSSMCRRVRCIAGVNGDFHKIGVPAGAVVVGGRMLHSPEPGRPQLSVLKDGQLVAGTFPWDGSLTGGNGTKVALNTVNAAPPANGLALFTPEYGPATDDSSRVELVVKASTVGQLNQATKLELVSLRTGAGPIPDDGAVLSGDGSAGQQLRDLWARRQAGGAPARLLISSPVDANMSLGVEPVVLKDGKRATPWRDPNVINPRQPHTLVGWNKEGHVYLVAVDGRQAASEGVTMAEAADFLLSLGVTDAVSLDGGGGTTFVAGGSVWNRPSDNNPDRPTEYAERGATNALVLLARPVAVTPQQAPPAPAPTTTSPSAVQSPTTPETTAPDFSSTPWSSAPTTLDGVAPAIGVDTQLAVGVGPSAAGSTTGRRGQPAPSDNGGGTADSDGSSDEDRSLVAQARSDLERGQDERASQDDYLQSTLSVAASLTTDRPSDKGGDSLPIALAALLAAAAVGAPGSLVLARRRSRPRCHEIPDPVLPDDVIDLRVEEAKDVAPEPRPVAELPMPDPDPTVEDVSIDAFAVVLGGEGARQWRDRPIEPVAPVDEVDPVDAVEPVDAAEVVRLVDLRLTYGLHELVLTDDAIRAPRRTAANR